MPDRIVAVIPIRSSDPEFREGGRPLLAGRPLVEYTVRAATEAQRIDRVIISTDSEAIAASCRGYGAEAPFLRPASLCGPATTVTEVLRHAVEWLEQHEGYQADWVVKLEITHPFRPQGLIDQIVETALGTGVDSAFVAYEERHSYWTLDADGRPQTVGEEIDVPRSVRRPFYRDVSGLVAITRTANLKAGRLYGDNVGLIPTRDLFALVDTHEKMTGGSYRDGVGFRLAELLAPAFEESAAWTPR